MLAAGDHPKEFNELGGWNETRKILMHKDNVDVPAAAKGPAGTARTRSTPDCRCVLLFFCDSPLRAWFVRSLCITCLHVVLDAIDEISKRTYYVVLFRSSVYLGMLLVP